MLVYERLRYRLPSLVRLLAWRGDRKWTLASNPVCDPLRFIPLCMKDLFAELMDLFRFLEEINLKMYKKFGV